jgi:pimeloyl-ACP methyl ester carboxylesterase
MDVILSRININDINIHYESHVCHQADPKETIILIHGYLSSVFSFRQLIPLLCDRFSVYALDLPGFGESDKSKTFSYSLANYGELIQSFMDRMGIETAALIGHSMGGQVALHAAKQSPSRVTKLILLASSGYLKPFKKRLIWLSYMPFFTWWVRRTFEQRNAWEVLKQVVYDASIIDQTMVDSYVAPMKSSSFYRAMIGLLREHGGDLTEDDLRTINVPSQLIWGRQDQIVPLAVGERLNKDLPGASLHVFDNTGHLLPEEKPQEVFEKIEAFLTEKNPSRC